MYGSLNETVHKVKRLIGVKTIIKNPKSFIALLTFQSGDSSP